MKNEQFTRKIVLAVSEYGTAVTVDSHIVGSYGYVATSEPLTVTFTPLPAEVVVQEQLAALDVVENKLRDELADKIARLDCRRNELRAITYSGGDA